MMAEERQGAEVMTDQDVHTRQALGGWLHGLCGRQVARVLRVIHPEEKRGVIEDASGVVAAFKRKGLTPPRLVWLCGELGAQILSKAQIAATSPKALAICFAAAAYPQRAFEIDKTKELPGRVAAFLEVLAVSGPVREALVQAGRLPSAVRDCPEAYAELLSDLSAADFVPRENRASTDIHQDQRDRRDGAAWFIATCCPEVVQRIHDNWQSEAEKVHYLRKRMFSLPLWMARMDTPKTRKPTKAYWDEVAQGLSSGKEDRWAPHHEFAVRLQSQAWRRVAEARNYHPQRIADWVGAFWEMMTNMLICGFPRYAFLSRFERWWKQWLINCVRPGRAAVLGLPGDDLLDPQQLDQLDLWVVSPTELLELTPEQLRWFREGFRLIRTMFFRRQDKQSEDEEGPAGADNPHEALRRVLDEIWYARLERKLGAEVPPEMVKRITRLFPEFNPATIHTWCRRLRLRIWAYALARVYGLRDSQIVWARVPPRLEDQVASRYPLRREAGVLTVAAVARIVPLHHTLLWAFLARLALHPLVQPQQPDPCPVRRFVRELWYWVTEVAFEDAVARGVDDHSRADEAASQAATWPAVGKLVRDLKQIHTEDQLDAYLARGRFGRVRSKAKRLARELAGRRGLHSGCTERLPQWRKRVPHRWIVPLWHLVVVQGLRDRALLRRLGVAARDGARVFDVADAMVECLHCKARRRCPYNPRRQAR